MMLWLILIGILIIIYLVEKLVLHIHILIEGNNKILIAIKQQRARVNRYR